MLRESKHAVNWKLGLHEKFLLKKAEIVLPLIGQKMKVLPETKTSLASRVPANVVFLVI